MAQTKKCGKKKLLCWSKKDKANKRYVACVCRNQKSKRAKCPKHKVRNSKTGRCVKSARKKQEERKTKMLKEFKRKAKKYRKARGSNLE